MSHATMMARHKPFWKSADLDHVVRRRASLRQTEPSLITSSSKNEGAESNYHEHRGRIIDAPPPHRNRFCGRCGSPVPVLSDGWFEVPAGTLDDDPTMRPDKTHLCGL
jgi:hypothetical protein